MIGITDTMSESFQGWLFDDTGDLVDPAGNRYRPGDLTSSFWMRQAWAARAGAFPGEIAFLRSVLDDRIREASFPLVVEVHQERPEGRVTLGTIRIGGQNPRPRTDPAGAVDVSAKRAA